MSLYIPQEQGVVNYQPPAPLPMPTPLSEPAPLPDISAPAEISSSFEYNSELQRICNLPIINPLTPEEIEAVSKRYMKADVFMAGERLSAPQANAIVHWDTFGVGLFGPIGVGWGKSLIGYMMAESALHPNKFNRRKAILVIPPNVRSQHVTIQLTMARRFTNISFAIHDLGACANRLARINLANSDRTGLYVFPYSLFQIADAEDLLKAIGSEVFILDEAHNFGSTTSARTKRFLRYIQHHTTNPMIAAMSGTLTSKGLMDYWHLCRITLKQYCYMPMSRMLTERWADVLDAKATEEYEEGVEMSYGSSAAAACGPIQPLLAWTRRTFPEEEIPNDIKGFRKSFMLRASCTPGYVGSGDNDIGISILFDNIKTKEDHRVTGADKRDALIEQVEKLWQTPGGDEIDYAFHKWGWLYTLTTGFYNDLYWPTPEWLSEHKRIGYQEALDIIIDSKFYHEKQQEYNRQLRRFLKDAPAKLDTPMLVAKNLTNHGNREIRDEMLYTAWQDMKDAEFDKRIERLRRPVRVCDSKIILAIDWAKAHKDTGGIIWYYNQEAGEWLHEGLQAAGIDSLFYPAGAVHDKNIYDVQRNKGRILVVSWFAHGTGKELQYSSHSLIIQNPKPAKFLEQLIGRQHRKGQQADEVNIDFTISSMFEAACYASTLLDALYIHQTQGSRQKAIIGTYLFKPEVFPHEVMREMGIRQEYDHDQLALKKFLEKKT